MMQLDDFNYTLPEELIAQHPLTQRDEARLMVINRGTGEIVDTVFKSINDYLPENSQIIVNNSRVIPARLLTKRESTGGEVELFLLKALDDGYSYEVLMRPAKRLKNGEKIKYGNNGTYAEIISKEDRIVRFNRKDITEFLEREGHIPLPPYIKREDDLSDREMYQTVYAKHSGSVASPTAGLHFTDALIKDLKSSGHDFHQLMLHINYGTFKPVEERDITQHKMHFEEYEISDDVWKKLLNAKEQARPIVGVGTTSTRVLESVALSGQLKGATNIFIYPGFEFNMIDHLLTNFHLPLSTLLMLIFAFGGEQIMKKAYCHAIEQKYRFYSYGDCMLIL